MGLSEETKMPFLSGLGRSIMGKAKSGVFGFRRRQRGSILIVGILVIVVMLILATPFLVKLSAQFRTTDKASKSLAAFNLAEAGVDRALFEMNNIWGWISAWQDTGSAITTTLNDFAAFGGGAVGDVEMVIYDPTGADGELRAVEATGKVPFIGTSTVDRNVRVNLYKFYKSIFDFGVFADEQIYARNNLTVDSYDSRNGSYASQTPGDDGHMGTNGTANQSIEVDQGDESSLITGNLAAGVGTNPDNLNNTIDLAPGVRLEGERKILSAPFEMPSVDLYNLPPQPRDMFDSPVNFQTWFTSHPDPAAPLSSGLIASGYNKGSYAMAQGGDATFTSANNGIYTSFNVSKSTLTINGDVAIYVTGLDGAPGSFTMQTGSSIIITQGSSLTLVFGKTTFSVTNNTTFQNQSGSPTDFIVLGTDQFTGTMNWKNNIETYAAFYVPRATFKGELANIHLYGAVVADVITLRNNINIHYDEALKQLDWVKGGLPYWEVVSWQERVIQD